MKKSLLLAAVSSTALVLAGGAWADGGPEPEPMPVAEPEPMPEPVAEPEPMPEPAPEYNWYTTIFAGVAFGDELEVAVDFGEAVEEFAFDLETGYLLGWTLGYDSLFGAGGFDLRPEVELSFRQQDTEFEGEGVEFSIPTDILSLLANLWIDFEMNGVTPYIGGGVGIGWADLPLGQGLHVESTDFVWQFGGGLNFDVNERVFLGLGYRYFGANFESDAFGAPAEYEYRAHEALANLGVRF